MTWATPDRYFDQVQHWLDLEGEAERERMAERRQNARDTNLEQTGETLLNLRIVDHRTGLSGRYLVDLGRPAAGRLPDHRLKVGSPVVVSDEADPAAAGIAGVVSRRRAETIQVALEEWPAAERIRLDLSADERTRLRQAGAIAQARLLDGRRVRLRDALLGLERPRFEAPLSLDLSAALNDSQAEAVRFALAARDVAVLHGPPGTGKTTALSEVVNQAVRSGAKVLACAPSNTAVDNLLECLVAEVPSVVRLGHPARVLETLRGHTLDEIVDSDDSMRLIQQMYREAEGLMRDAHRRSRSSDAHRRRGELIAEAKTLRQQARLWERQIIQHALDAADVICSTLTIDEELLGQRQFDLVVIDEACQATEPAIWQAMLRAERMVLAGDHCQLPPTVVSVKAAREGLGVSPMERLVHAWGADVHRRMTIQYRMHEEIMRFSSDHFYDGELVAHPSVRAHRLADLAAVTPEAHGWPVLEFWDTAGAGWDEELEADGQSRCNPQEAVWVARQVEAFLSAGVAPEQIGVIAPYAAQIRRLRLALQTPGLEIDTVDGFQGREKDVVIISFVRSNPTGEIGFLGDIRRTNVALTRAKRALRAVGDSATLGGNAFYAQLLAYFEEMGAYRSVWELSDET